jgi:hypothetical protein
LSYALIRSKADPKTGKNEFAGGLDSLYDVDAVSVRQYVNAIVIMITA